MNTPLPAPSKHTDIGASPWYAVIGMRIFQVEKSLAPYCDEVFLPKETVRSEQGTQRVRAAIPRMMFIRTGLENALDLERKSRDRTDRIEPFFLFRTHGRRVVPEITDQEIHLLRLLTANDSTRCEIYRKNNVREGDHVQITGGPFAGYTGYVRRIRKNKHVVVEVEGVCAIALPFIHPDLLAPI